MPRETPSLTPMQAAFAAALTTGIRPTEARVLRVADRQRLKPISTTTTKLSYRTAMKLKDQGVIA